MDPTRSACESRLLCVLIGGAIALWFAPEQISGQVRGLIRDALVPGQRVLLAMYDTGQPPEDVKQDAQQAALQAVIRNKELQLARLRQQIHQLETYGASAFQKIDSEPLIEIDALTARVISPAAFPELPAEIVVDRGRRGDVTADLFAVVATDTTADSAAVLDVGRDAELSEGDRVFAGRCAVGRVQRTGMLSSVLQLITHPDYSHPAQLAHRTPQGLNFGAQGILTGSGAGTCTLHGIPDNATVSVGDDVFTPDLPGRPRLFFGKVISAELRPGSTWNIVIRPHVDFAQLSRVEILRARVNEKRLVDL